MVAEWLLDRQHLAPAREVEYCRDRVDDVLVDDGGAIGVGVVHVGEVLSGVECGAEETALTVGRSEVGDVEHHLG